MNNQSKARCKPTSGSSVNVEVKLVVLVRSRFCKSIASVIEQKDKKKIQILFGTSQDQNDSKHELTNIL